MRKSGFTLLELLVVIAIIGILASVVIASLSSVRNKGTNTAIKQEMNSILTQGQLYLNGKGTYGQTDGTAKCSKAENLDSMFNASNGNGADVTVNLLSKIGQMIGDPTVGADPIIGYSKIICYAQSDSFVVGVVLPDGEGVYCIDWRNTKKLYPGATDTPDNYVSRDSTSSASPQPFICR